jgi:hypothetical protein
MEGPQAYTLMTGVRFSCRLLSAWQIGNALGCDPSPCGFKSRRTPVTEHRKPKRNLYYMFRGIIIGLLILVVLYGGLLLHYRLSWWV